MNNASDSETSYTAQHIRHKTMQVMVGNVAVGGDAPIAIQSMTNTDTADALGTYEQIKRLHHAGSEIIRITVNNDEAAIAVPSIRNMLLKDSLDIPLVGCFHYNGHRLLTDYPDCAEALDKYRINPGNVGFGHKRDTQFESIINTAIRYDKPVRIGVNWGSLDQSIISELMDKNSRRNNPLSAEQVMQEAIVISTLTSAEMAEKIGLAANKIILSAKMSRVPMLIAVYQEIAKKSNYAIHLGLTEAGMGHKGIVSTAAAEAILLHEGIGDTIRASLTPRPGGDRETEVEVCKLILQALELRSFAPQITACPGCGRTTSTYFQELAADIETYIQERNPVWKIKYPGSENMKIAVMGCIVNGPGESKHADIGISLPGTGEDPVAPVFINGVKVFTLKGDISSEFKNILEDFVESRYS